MVVISLAVWLTFPLKEVSGTNLLLAVCAHKMLWMPCAPHGSYYLYRNTHTHLCLDVSNSFYLGTFNLSWKLKSSHSSLICVCGVALLHPHLANNGFAAGATHSLGNCLHSQLVEVRLKTAQHVV